MKPKMNRPTKEGLYYCDRDPFRRQIRFWPGHGDEVWDGNCGEPVSDYTNFEPVDQPLTCRQLRLATNTGMREFAMSVGLLPSRFCNVENGSENPTEDELKIIANGLASKPQTAH